MFAGTAIVFVCIGLLVPIKTNEAECGLGKRFSLILGQYNKFEAAESNDADEIGACPAYVHDYTPNRLYIL